MGYIHGIAASQADSDINIDSSNKPLCQNVLTQC